MLAVQFNDAEAQMLKNSAYYHNISAVDFVREAAIKQAEAEKAARNAAYTEMIDRGLKQMEEGGGRLVTTEELEMMLNE